MLSNAVTDALLHPTIRVLLVEDNPKDALLVGELLKDSPQSSFETTHVPLVSKAAERLAQDQFDAVLLDLSLPDGHGLEILERIRKVDPKMPIIVLTGSVSDEIATRAIQNGAQDFLPKNEINVFLLSRTIRYAIERKEVEKKLAASEERFRRSFDDAPIGLALVSLDGHWLRVNRALTKMLGRSETELLATNFQTLTHPEDLKPDLDLIQLLLTGQIRDYKMEKRYFHKSGDIVYVQLNVSPVRAEDDNPLYFVSQIQDITERKRHEAERETLIKELRIALAEVKTLSGMIPICGWCKKVRNDQGYWSSVEQFVRTRTGATFSHGVCPDCAKEFKEQIQKSNEPSSSPPAV